MCPPHDPDRRLEAILTFTSPLVTAVMVDGAFFVKRSRHVWGKLLPEEAAKRLHQMALGHLRENGIRVSALYRIFVYDAPPIVWRGHTPIERKPLDLSKSDEAKWRAEFHRQLLRRRKVALRLGVIPTSSVRWQIRPDTLKSLISGKREWDSLNDDDFILEMRQKYEAGS